MAAVRNMSNPTDWFQSYQTNFSNTTQPDQIPPISAAVTDGGASSRNNYNLLPDQGRIAKPLRRRSRASRRTPTTLLNTDPTNFRAMVQHFTGGPSMQQQFAVRPQFPSGSGGGPNFGFTQQYAGTNAAVAPASGFHVQYPNQQEQIFMMSNMRGGGGGSGGVSSHAPPGQSSESVNRSFENYML